MKKQSPHIESYRERRILRDSYFSSTGSQCLATIIAVKGSSFRKKGAQLLICENLSSVGSLSGGCIEREICLKAKEVFGDLEPKIFIISTGGDEDDLYGSSTGCEGLLTILIEPLKAGLSLDELEKFIGPTRSGNDVSESFKNISLSIDDGSVTRVVEKHTGGYQYTVSSPPDVIIFGTEGASKAIAEFCLSMGYNVTLVGQRATEVISSAMTVIQKRPTSVDFKKLPKKSFVIVSTHNLWDDEHILSSLSLIQPKYVGLIGSKKRISKLEKFVDIQALKNSCLFYSPAGQGNKAYHTPEQLAFSVFSQLQAMIEEDQQHRHTNVAGVILAAGNSTRFKDGPKQFSTIFNKSLLRIQAEKLSLLDLTKKMIIVQNKHLKLAIEEVKHLGEIEVIGIDTNSGMGETLSLACRECSNYTGLLVMLSDQPLIPVAHYRKVLSSFSSNPSLDVATQASKPMVPAILSKSMVSSLTNLKGDRGAHNLLEKATTVKCLQAEFDIDTTTDLKIASTYLNN